MNNKTAIKLYEKFKTWSGQTGGVRLISAISVLLLIIIQLPFILYYTEGFIRNYLTCPNNEFMSWDPELRFILTLNMMDDLHEFRIFHFLLQILDSPHWPALRNVIQTAVFMVTSPSQNNDIYITVATMLLVPLALLWIYFREAGTRLLVVPIFFFISWSVLFRSEEYMLYTFTAMMEIQGSLFFLLTIYFLAGLYANGKEPLSAKQSARNLLYLGIFSQLLYHTKYPYGYMLIVSVVFFHGLFHFRETLEYAVLYLNRTRPWKNWKWILAAVLLLLHILLPAAMMKGKTSGYIKYLVALLLFADFMIWFVKSRKENLQKFRIITNLLQWVVLPIVIWFLMNPDRLMSSTNQISHFEVQGYLPHQVIKKNADYYFVFLIEFIVSVFTEVSLALFLLGMNLLLIVRGVWLYYKKREIQASFYISFIIFLTFLVLSLFTSNRHIRHTFHLYPAMIAAPLLFILEISRNRIMAWLLSAAVMIVMTGGFIAEPARPFEFDLCYTGLNPADYTLPRWIKSEIPDLVKTDTVLVNRVDPGHVNRADTEFVIKQYTYGKQIRLLTDPKLSGTVPVNYKTVIVPGNTCQSDDELVKMKESLGKTGRSLLPDRTVKSDYGCIRVYRIE